MSPIKALVSTLLCAASLLHLPLYANEVGVEINVGLSNADVEGYDAATAGNLGVLWHHQNWSYRAGLVHLGKLELSRDDSSNGNYGHIEVNGGYLQIGHRFNFAPIALEVGGGALLSTSKASLDGNRVDEDDDVSPYLDLRIIKSLAGGHVGLQGGFRYFVDVSGSDLNNPYVGVIVSF